MAEEAARAFFKERNEENTSQEIAVGSHLLHFPESGKSAQAATVWFLIFLISTQDRKGLKSSF